MSWPWRLPLFFGLGFILIADIFLSILPEMSFKNKTDFSQLYGRPCFDFEVIGGLIIVKCLKGQAPSKNNVGFVVFLHHKKVAIKDGSARITFPIIHRLQRIFFFFKK